MIYERFYVKKIRVGRLLVFEVFEVGLMQWKLLEMFEWLFLLLKMEIDVNSAFKC